MKLTESDRSKALTSGLLFMALWRNEWVALVTFCTLIYVNLLKVLLLTLRKYHSASQNRWRVLLWRLFNMAAKRLSSLYQPVTLGTLSPVQKSGVFLSILSGSLLELVALLSGVIKDSLTSVVIGDIKSARMFKLPAVSYLPN